jgi:hypothetical protein
MAEERYRYDVFLSYARGGTVEPFVRDVFYEPFIRALREAHPHREPTVFLDEQSIRVGEHIPDEVRAALPQSRLMLAFLSPMYARKHWCLEEWRAFSGPSPSGGPPRLYPLLVQDGDLLDAQVWHRSKWDARFKPLLLQQREHLAAPDGLKLLREIAALAETLIPYILQVQDPPAPLPAAPRPVIAPMQRTFPDLRGSDG